MIFAFPTNDELFAIFVAWPAGDLEAVRRDPERELLAVVDLVPELAERVRASAREERMLAATRLPNVLRQSAGPGWALVGDAGCHKDPYSALGVCDALRDAELLAESLGEMLSGSRSEADAAADYWRRRDAPPVPRECREGGARPVPPDLLARRAAVRGDQEAMNRLLLVGEGLLAPTATGLGG
jgi:2-polyprenyl-6-methoxyphenol hydroxylase-like FAD-dependent oxidoreductase